MCRLFLGRTLGRAMRYSWTTQEGCSSALVRRGLMGFFHRALPELEIFTSSHSIVATASTLPYVSVTYDYLPAVAIRLIFRLGWPMATSKCRGRSRPNAILLGEQLLDDHIHSRSLVLQMEREYTRRSCAEKSSQQVVGSPSTTLLMLGLIRTVRCIHVTSLRRYTLLHHVYRPRLPHRKAGPLCFGARW